MKKIIVILLAVLVIGCTLPLEEAVFGTEYVCPICGGELVTFRHPGAAIWCRECGYVVREEQFPELEEKP